MASTPDPGGTGGPEDISELFGAYCTSARNCWAVGDYGMVGIQRELLNQVLHWNGRRWSKTSLFNPDGAGIGASNSLEGVTCTTAANCWAVGTYGSISGGGGVILNQAQRWNGHGWSLVATPDPGGTANGDNNFLTGVRCWSAALCWAVGDQQPMGQSGINEALRWNGRHWLVG